MTPPDLVPLGRCLMGCSFPGNNAESNWVPFAHLPDPYLGKIEAAHTREANSRTTHSVSKKRKMFSLKTRLFKRSITDCRNINKMFQKNKNDKNDSYYS